MNNFGPPIRARSDPYPRLINRPNRGAPIGPNHTVPYGTVPVFAPIPGNKLPGYFRNVPTGQRQLTPVHEFDSISSTRSDSRTRATTRTIRISKDLESGREMLTLVSQSVAENFYQETIQAPKSPFDLSLRPPLFSEFQGQARVKERRGLMVAAAKQLGDVLELILLSGPPGLGKTSLAFILANAMGVNIKSTSGPMIERAGDLAGLLTTLERGDILFIDDIHRPQPAIEEYLYPALVSFHVHII